MISVFVIRTDVQYVCLRVIGDSCVCVVSYGELGSYMPPFSGTFINSCFTGGGGDKDLGN